MNPLISICMPAYNAGAFIRESIQSVLDQTYANWELIIVNDGSTDNTSDVVAAFAGEKRIRFSYQENKGQCNASNNAYRQSQGSLIKFLDADDIIEREYLENMVRAIDGPYTLAFSHCINFYGNLERQNPYEIPRWRQMSPINFLVDVSSNMRQGGRWLIPRQLIERGGLWNEELSLINDHEYFTRLCLAADKIVYTKEAILYYRQVDNSLSSQKSYGACLSAYHSILWAGQQMLEREHSDRIRLHIANSFKDLLFQVYPKYPDLVLKIEKEIKSLGGADKVLGGGNITLLSNAIIGWKGTVRIKHFFRHIATTLRQPSYTKE